MPENTSLILEEGTKCIAGAAFQECHGLASITIPSSVVNIGTAAFERCSNLKTIYVWSKNPPKVNSLDKSNIEVHVPYGCKTVYKEKSPWSSYTIIDDLIDFLRGDANGDGKIDMNDATFVVNIILGTEEATEAADVNFDGAVNMPDAMFIVNKILNGKFPDEK